MSAGVRVLVSADDDATAAIPAVEDEARELVRSLSDALPAEAELSVYLVRDERMRELNETWREQDRPTDVLSFSQEGDGPGGETLLGDVVINLDAAQRQATEHDLEPAEEIRFLLIHGVLHLLGFDHHTDDERSSMEAEEQRLWESLGGEGTIR